MKKALLCGAALVVMCFGCDGSGAGAEEANEAYVEYDYSGGLTWSDGASSETILFPTDSDECAAWGHQSWYRFGDFEGAVLEAGCDMWFTITLESAANGKPGWPNGDQEVPGEFILQGKRASTSFSIGLLESVGTFYLPPDGPTRDYVREFTVEGKVDCAEFPELGCEGVYELSLRTRIDFESVELFVSGEE